MNEFTNTQIISGLLAIVAATYAAFFAWIVRRFDRLEERFDGKLDGRITQLEERLNARIDKLEERLDERIDKLDEKFSGELRTVFGKLDALTIAVSRLEGAVWHTPPERRVAGEQS